MNERLSLREILSRYDANQLNHLIGTKWGIRFKGKDDYVQFYLEKLSMDCYIKGVLKKLSKDEVELLKLLAIRGAPTDESSLKKMQDGGKWSFVGAVTNLMSYFLVYSSKEQYYVPEEMIEPLKKAMCMKEMDVRSICDKDIRGLTVKGNAVYDILAILWAGATGGIELTQKDEMQKYALEKVLSLMNSTDSAKEEKMRTYLRFLIEKGILYRKKDRLMTNADLAKKLLEGDKSAVMRRLVSECSDIAVLKYGMYSFRSIKGIDEFLEEVFKLDANSWYDLETTADRLKNDGIKSGNTARWVFLPKEDIETFLVILGWFNFLIVAETNDGRRAIRLRDREEMSEEKFLIVNPNFEVTLFLDRAKLSDAFALLSYGEIDSVEVATNERLKKELVISGSAMFGDPIPMLRKHSMKPMPKNVEVYIKEWLDNRKTVEIKNVKLLVFDKVSQLNEIVLKYPGTLKKMGPKTAIIEKDEVIEELKREGYSLLGN